MPNRPKNRRQPVVVAAVSGGPDSVYLLRKLSADKFTRVVVGHVNYGTRGIDSDKDQKLVEKIGKTFGYDTEILSLDAWVGAAGSKGASGAGGNFPAGFERKARDIRYRFLRDLSEKVGAEAIALAHTADDQVETILMRVFEGAGIGGLKGIPRETDDGIVRPILDVWKEEILGYLKKRKIPYRIDRSNVDTRFERNWVRNVLIPLLVKRYGKAVKKRIFTLGERFRELDDYLETEAQRWIGKNIEDRISSFDRKPTRKKSTALLSREEAFVRHEETGREERSGREKVTGRLNDGSIRFRRERYSVLPTVLRVKILQRICFDRLGIAPNERLLDAMDRNVSGGGPSAQVNAGKGWRLANRYDEAVFLHDRNASPRKSTRRTLGAASTGEGAIGGARKETTGRAVPIAAPGKHEISAGRNGGGITLVWKAKGKIAAAQARRLAATGDAEVFDVAGLKLPLTVRLLRAGDRIRPFGGSADGKARGGGKKVKEILIDRKTPREERWGRPVVCDADGKILWIPGVLRSAHAPVTPRTGKTALLRIRSTK